MGDKPVAKKLGTFGDSCTTAYAVRHTSQCPCQFCSWLALRRRLHVVKHLQVKKKRQEKNSEQKVLLKNPDKIIIPIIDHSWIFLVVLKCCFT